jgi:hypothetical protein
MDYDKTYQAYKALGMGKKFEELPDYARYKKEERWYEKVKNAKGEYYQADELVSKDLVPPSWKPPRLDSKGKPVKYPIIEVNELIRKRLVDGTEWLLSRQNWIALDSAGNEVNISMNDKECFDDVLPVYALKPENPKDNPRFKDTKMISVVDRLEKRIKYTLPFSAKDAQRLYDMRNGKCSLCVIDQTGPDYPPVSVPTFDSFRDSAFTEMFELLTTPKLKMDRSYGDNLDSSHIG